MKKYAEVVKRQRTPLTAEELKDIEVGLIDAINTADKFPEWGESVGTYATAKRGVELLAEVKHLRRMMAIAYHWIGRKAPAGTTANRDYMAALKEAARIRKEDE